MSDPTGPAAAGPSDTELEAQLTNYDPVWDVPSNVSVRGEPRILEPSLSAFPPETRQRIEQQLASVSPESREERQRALIIGELTKASREFRVRGGLGEGATKTQQADAEIANRTRLLQQDEQRIASLLDEVRMVIDPVTGEPLATADKVIQGEQRRAYETQLFDVRRQMNLLAGYEGEKLRRDAIEADKRIIRERERSLAEMQEGRRRAEQLESEERINRIAEGHRKRIRTNIG